MKGKTLANERKLLVIGVGGQKGCQSHKKSIEIQFVSYKSHGVWALKKLLNGVLGSVQTSNHLYLIISLFFDYDWKIENYLNCRTVSKRLFIMGCTTNNWPSISKLNYKCNFLFSF